MERKTMLGSAAVIALLAIIIVSAALVNPIFMTGQGQVRSIGVEVYADENLTTIMSTLDYGMIDPGETKSIPVWIKNIGNHPVYLSMWTDTWTPTDAGTYIVIDNDYDSSTINKDAVYQMNITCSVSPAVENIDSFTFVVWVQAVKA